MPNWYMNFHGIHISFQSVKSIIFGQWSYQSYFTNIFLINVDHYLTSKFKNNNTEINKKTFRAWGEVLPGLKLFTYFNYNAKVFPQLSCNPTNSFNRNYVEGKAVVFLMDCFFPVKILCDKVNILLSDDEEGIT